MIIKDLSTYRQRRTYKTYHLRNRDVMLNRAKH